MTWQKDRRALEDAKNAKNFRMQIKQSDKN
jgi:hypothetical protein